MSTYSRQTWVDYPNTSSPINANRLNHMENGIYEADLKGSLAQRDKQDKLVISSDGYIYLDGEPEVTTQPEI